MIIKCDYCELARINGILCHETGCPNMKSDLVIEDNSYYWRKYRICRECGDKVYEDNDYICDCQLPVNEDKENE